MPEPFSRRLASAMARAGSPVCVGLDPVADRLPEAVRAEHWEPVRAIEAFCRGVIDAVADHAGVVKPQSACFERFGSAGIAALERVINHSRARGLLVILDAKRGDIGISAEHYAAAAAGMGADAITASPYLGIETIEPYLAAGLGVFCLVRTSNPGGDELQSHPAGTTTVAGLVARQLAALGERHLDASGVSNVGAVVGATQASEAAQLRAVMPKQVFLVPGYGAQGGSPGDVRAMLGASHLPGRGVLVTASRSVIYAAAIDNTSWMQSVHDAAARFNAEIAGVVG